MADCDRAGMKPACFRSPKWAFNRDHRLKARSTTYYIPAHDRIGRSERLPRSGGMFGFSRIISGQNSLCPVKRGKLTAFSVRLLKESVDRNRTHDWIQGGVTSQWMRGETQTQVWLSEMIHCLREGESQKRKFLE